MNKRKGDRDQALTAEISLTRCALNHQNTMFAIQNGQAIHGGLK